MADWFAWNGVKCTDYGILHIYALNQRLCFFHLRLEEPACAFAQMPVDITPTAAVSADLYTHARYLCFSAYLPPCI